jgi:SAM-dependent methyltransferase
MMAHGSLPAAYFEALFQTDPDPWGFGTSPYEQAKYAATLAALPRQRYRHALELGCANGVLTRLLAARCGTLLAVDCAATALTHAQARCADLPGVRFEQRTLPAQFPTGAFDLIVLSEMGYYLSVGDLRQLRQRIVAALVPGGQLVLVHWTPPIEGRLLSGDAVHALMLAPMRTLRQITGQRMPRYRLDVLERCDPVGAPRLHQAGVPCGPNASQCGGCNSAP